MTKGTPKDPRSTGRKRGRLVLERSNTPKVCGGRPYNAAPATYCCGMKESEQTKMQVNHRNKNILDNDESNLEWICPSCHALYDRQTEKGISPIGDSFGYPRKDM